MRLLELEEKKRMALEILGEIDILCKAYNITYYLAYGTLIGAIRHSGFIPWDDDIDLWIPTSDYDRLLDVLNNESKYTLLDNRNNPKWPRVFSKLCYPKTHVVDRRINAPQIERGLAVDLFPLFRIKNPTNDFEAARKVIRRLNGFAMLDGKVKPNSVGHGALMAEAKLNRLIRKDVLFWQNEFWKINNDGSSPYLSYLGSKYGKVDIHDATLYSETTQVIFEGKEYPAPKGYHEILTKIYGEYTSLPPVEKRVSVHDVDVFIDD